MLFEFSTPIQKLDWKGCDANIYIKRDDLIGFSFGGNKVRIAAQYLEDMRVKGCDCMIAYGSTRSNMCRVAANMCCGENIPCYVVTALSEGEELKDTFNSIMVDSFGARIRYCRKDNVAGTISELIEELKAKGYRPYYIFGDIYGKGNEDTAARAYEKAYKEILDFEKESGVSFDGIFLASGTGMTQGGLIRGQKKYGGNARITGISISREREPGVKAVAGYAAEPAENIDFNDEYRLGGYAQYDDEVRLVINDMMKYHGIPMDTTYTGKAFAGMLKWLKKYGSSYKNVLFIHTGGTPLFFDGIDVLKKQETL